MRVVVERERALAGWGRGERGREGKEGGREESPEFNVAIFLLWMALGLLGSAVPALVVDPGRLPESPKVHIRVRLVFRRQN